MLEDTRKRSETGFEKEQEGKQMNAAAGGMTWKEIAADLTKDFMAWGCRFDRKSLPEIAMGYECTPLFFWNWMDDPETPRSEKGFLRVLGYAWRKYLQEEAEPASRRGKASGSAGAKTNRSGRIAA